MWCLCAPRDTWAAWVAWARPCWEARCGQMDTTMDIGLKLASKFAWFTPVNAAYGINHNHSIVPTQCFGQGCERGHMPFASWLPQIYLTCTKKPIILTKLYRGREMHPGARWHSALGLPGAGTASSNKYSHMSVAQLLVFFFYFLGKYYWIFPYSLGMLWNEQNGKWALNWGSNAPFTCNLLWKDLDQKYAKLVYDCSLTKFPVGKGTMELSTIFH